MCRPPMARAYNVIDADGHILEPLDLSHKIMCATDYPLGRLLPGRAPDASRAARAPVPEARHQVLAAAPLASTA
jgi:hypothetical protein